MVGLGAEGIAIRKRVEGCSSRLCYSLDLFPLLHLFFGKLWGSRTLPLSLKKFNLETDTFGGGAARHFQACNRGALFQMNDLSKIYRADIVVLTFYGIVGFGVGSRGFLDADNVVNPCTTNWRGMSISGGTDGDELNNKGV